MEKLKYSFNTQLQSTLSCFFFSFIICWQSSKSLFTFRLIFEIVMSLLPLVSMYLGKEVINTLVSLTTADNPILKPLFILIICLFIIELFNIGSQKLIEILTGTHKDKINNYVNEQMIKKCADLDISFFDSPTYYDNLLNVRRDSASVESMVWSITGVVKSIIQLIAAGIILSGINILFPLVFICLNVSAIIIEKRFTQYIYNWMYNRAPEDMKLSYIQ